ncbi:TetR/AcrR family transcriptional regulator [Acidocella sp.]|uniref:TetR/AcrR family transcriptional regulator n=2 Tax=Acidocella sp. TaxID=50710 RepID=UPI002601C407|nr:TetR/AcrR family transcriptional regulator [Acidocella sp.]
MAGQALPSAAHPPRKPRADATRNHERLLETAKTVFAEKGPAASLDEIAKAAGVGIGTLYRHFPTRDALVEQVYRHETTQLAEAAERLRASHPPVEALRQWLFLFVEYFTTKQIMAQALSATAGGTATLYAISSVLLNNAVSTLAEQAVARGEIRLTLEPMDLLRAIAGVGNVSPGRDWEERAKRLVDILIAGLRVPQAGG